MTRLFAKSWIYKRFFTLAVLSFLVNTGHAQPECRSILGSYMKPLADSLPLNWATEFSTSAGVMSDRFIFNEITFVGLEYVSKSMIHQLYFEGAFKYWYNTANGPGLDGTGTGYSDFTKPEKKHFGFRELFYAYNDWLDFKAGIQSMKSNGSFLLDERVLGLSAKKKWNTFDLSFSGGTVYDDIARMQDFCATRHLYNLVNGNKVNFVGDKIFDSNFFLAEFSWQPDKKTVNTNISGDGFGAFEDSDEFSDFSSSEEIKKVKPVYLKNIGFRLYEEFGKVFPAYKYYAGSSFNLEIMEKLKFNGEIIGQLMDGNDAVFWRAVLQKEKFRKNGAFSEFKIEYLGNYAFGNNPVHFPSFSNLFKGEVMRLDVNRLPLMDLEYSYRFANSMKSTFKGNYIHQFNNEKTREFDLVYSTQPWKHVHLYAIGAYIKSEVLANDNFLFKLETRIAF